PVVRSDGEASGLRGSNRDPRTLEEGLAMLERVESDSSSRGRRLLDFSRQLALIAGAALLYFGVRGQTEGSESLAVAHGLDLIAFERIIGLDVEAGLQSLILPHRWAVTVANWVYIWGHWPVIGGTLVWLYRTRRFDYLLVRNALFFSGAIGLAIFVTYPVAPPRLLPTGFVDTVTELSTSYRVLQPPSLVNKYAALPSLHVGWNLLIGMAVFRAGANRFARVFGVLSPTAMVAAVVLTGNHYLVDAILGAVVALAGLALAFWLTPKLTVVRNTRNGGPVRRPTVDRPLKSMEPQYSACRR
ncbi:MAG: phosphatase PAP2 family protein, partial [Acidimicrobiales bacterium]